MLKTHQAHHDELDACLTVLQNTHNMVTKSTLWKFYNNLRLAWVALDNEMIMCRRLNKVTPKYKDLETVFNAHYKNFEQWQVMAALMH